LDASKLLKQQQASEYGEISDSGRKVNLIFMFNNIELSNVEFKRADISSGDVTVQCPTRKMSARACDKQHMHHGESMTIALPGSSWSAAELRFHNI